jgi:serine/threonine protein kinase/tetratricopeptide (TPR) repeat protein
MEDPKSQKGGRKGLGGGPQGVGVPAKGDSSGGTPPDPMDGATISDVPLTPPPPPAAKPVTRVVHPDATISDSLAAMSVSSARQFSDMYMKAAILQPGDLIGTRYEILQLLGEGGMGSVYKALDREVARTVALKLIRPELALNPSILARFKQELLTSHQVTHKNVIRIYDIAEADGVKFITMEFVDGSDLRRILIDNGKLPPERAVEIVRQVCLALDAAHSAGVIHRDLKPQNIMQEAKTGRILVMDFGLARSMEGDGMTQTGALLGTIEYMSPEQSMGKTLDQRSDIFAVGLIFYELLIGKTPYRADTAVASLLRRNQERAVPAAELDSSVPKVLSDIVSKCLERDLEHRYQNVREILADLDALQGARPTMASISLPKPAAAKLAVPWKWIGIGALAVLVVGGGWVLKSGVLRSGSTSGVGEVKGPEVSLAILPFQNGSGDPTLDWLGSNLADMLSTEVGQSAHLRIISPDRLHQVLSDLRVTPGTSIDPTMIGRIAEFSNADTVVWGKYVRFGDKIHIEATVQDLKQDRRVPVKIDAASEKEIPGSVDQLAELIRQNLSVSSDVVKELKANSFQPSSKSVPALRDYTQGVELVREGKNLDAVKMLESAVKEDPQFALAYSRLAETDLALGYDSEAEKNSRRAMELSQSLPTAEKYLVEATHAVVMKDNKKAIEAYQNLAKTFPGNTDVAYTLGSLYSDNGDLDKARAQFAAILKADPKNIKTLWQMGSLEYQQGNPQKALEPLNTGLSLAVQVDNQEQKALILQALGISYRLMNKPEEAIKSIQDSMEITRKLGMKRLLANSLSELAQDQITIGKPDAAMASYNQALETLKAIGVKKDYGDIQINRGVLYQTRGEYDQALQDYKDALEIQRDAGDVNYQAVCLSNIGDVYFLKDDSDNALIYYQQSLQLREKLNEPLYLAETLSALGDVRTAMGDYDEALKNLMTALEVSRKANISKSAASVSESIGKILMYQGRLGAATSAMQDSVSGYRSTNNKSTELAESLNSLADTLALAGRGDESGKLLEEAASIASEFKNENIHTAIVNTQGDAAFYRGEYKTARPAYEQAAVAAAKTKDRETILITKMNLARLAIAEGRAQEAIPKLRAAIQQADKLHLKYFSIRSSVDLAEALIKTKDYAHARQELENATSRSEKLGLRLETARIQFLLGSVMHSTGNATDAAVHYQQATALWNELKKESGAEKVLERSDLKAMVQEASQGAQQAKNELKK